MLSIDQQIGRYRVLSTIGAGGMGEVFLAEDIELERLAAIKILPEGYAGITDRVNRFIQEAKAASALNHPNILTIYEIGTVNETRFMVSEYIEGITIREKIKRETLTVKEVLEIAIQIGSALDSAHSHKIIHRDIKPENIMIRADNLVKVLDFGLAKLSEQSELSMLSSQSPTREQIKTKSGIILGTVAYMSPEQARGKTVDYRTDIFSLGVVLYEMLTGAQPFVGETGSDILASILMKEPDNPSNFNPKISSNLEKIVLKTLSKKPENRYQSVKDFLADIKLEFDFEHRNSGSKSAGNSKSESRTQILGADTDKTVRVITSPINEKNSSRIPLIKSTRNTDFPAKLKSPLLLIPIFAALILLIFLLLPLFLVHTPPTAGLKLFDAGTEALREGSFYKAGKLFEEAVKTDGDFAKARAGLAEAWMELDYIGRAQIEILKVNELQKKNSSLFSFLSRNNDSLYLEAVNAMVMRDFSRAITAYQKLAERDPYSSYVYLDLGRAFEKNEEIEKAIENYQRSIALNPQSGAAFLRLGILQRRRSDYENSTQSFDKAEHIFDLQSNDEALAEVSFQRGVTLNFQEKTDEARSQFEQVISMPRANPHQKIRAMLQISSSCAGEGNADCAANYAAKAIDIAKNERMENIATGGLIDLGNSFLARGDYDKAEQNYRQALDFARNDAGLKNEARALLAMGSLRIQQKKPDEAENFTGQSVSFFQNGNYDKELAQANLIIGRANEMRGDFTSALKYFELVENSGKAAIADKAYAEMAGGNVLLKLENFPQALQKFEKSYERYKSLNSSFYMVYDLFYLSDTSVRMGKFEESLRYLQDAENLMKDTGSPLQQITQKKHLLNSQIAYYKQNYALAVLEAKLIDLSKKDSDVFLADSILCLAQIKLQPKDQNGLQNCFDALKDSETANDSRSVNSAKLTLSMAYLNAEDYRKALETSLSVKDYFAANNLKESLWKTYFVAASAQSNMGETLKSKDLSRQALEIFKQLKSDWGEELFNIYLSNPEVEKFYNQAQKLSQS